ncbi:LOW QUALITY PROTEIN: hypothetical protein PoB_000924100 [Plakobranchus ocellatus]|uniref:Uncharacterized protein n=1 Tax=Plakobranchus ocellatus TaxID=259542 RepID=A0AAV3YK43_9GAST|nr:LOW QUALITY PROTEIN: hypothetical protein PoB_000924100 [Plakobranchus ocellatus]
MPSFRLERGWRGSKDPCRSLGGLASHFATEAPVVKRRRRLNKRRFEDHPITSNKDWLDEFNHSFPQLMREIDRFKEYIRMEPSSSISRICSITETTARSNDTHDMTARSNDTHDMTARSNDTHDMTARSNDTHDMTARSNDTHDMTARSARSNDTHDMTARVTVHMI